MKNVALVGNSNVGKTTLFNNITRSDEHTGNWAGVTVDEKSKQGVSYLSDCMFFDLPGIYSFNCFSMEEKTAKRFLDDGKADVVVNIAECNNLARNLFLTLQLMETGSNVVLLVNMLGEVLNRGGKVNLNQLSQKLGISVLGVDARDKENSFTVMNKAAVSKKRTPILPYLDGLPFSELLRAVQKNLNGKHVDSVYAAVRLFEQDIEFFAELELTETQIEKIKAITKPYGDTRSYLTKKRYEYIDSFISEVLLRTNPAMKFERLLLNKVFSVLFFLSTFAALFWIAFSKNGLGGLIAAQIGTGVDNLKYLLSNFMTEQGCRVWLISFVNDAVIEGLGAIISFLPQIVILFLFLNALEDTGYIARVAFTFDGLMAKAGLSGKSVLTLLLGFGCNTTAVLTSKNLNNKEVQKRTLLLLPFVPCSAKTPIFLVVFALAAPLFDGWEFFVIFLLYAVAVLVAAVVAGLLHRFDGKPARQDFVFELSALRLPSAARVLSAVWKHTKSFVLRVAGMLLVCVVVAWFLKSFDFRFNFLASQQISDSILAWIGNTFAFLFKPLGIFDWRICVALILGVTAKEVVAGTLVLLFGGSFGAGYDIHSIIVLLVFTLLYVPCIATLSAIRAECGGKTAAFSAFLNVFAAYSVCLVYTAFVNIFKLSPTVGFAAVGTGIVAAAVWAAVRAGEKRCGNCRRCKKTL